MQPPLQRDLIFVGGGHTHALVLKMLAMKPLSGLRITLVSPDTHTPYSGMLPGLVAGHYNFEQTHIDLARLCQWAGVRFIRSRVVALNPKRRELQVEGRPPLSYDLLNIDIGCQPEVDSVPGATGVTGQQGVSTAVQSHLSTLPQFMGHRKRQFDTTSTAANQRSAQWSI